MDVHLACPRAGSGKMYVGGLHTRFPDAHVEILDLIAEDDRVVARNRWTGTEATSSVKHEWSGIVIWRIAHRQFVKRWAYVQPPQPIKSSSAEGHVTNHGLARRNSCLRRVLLSPRGSTSR